MKHLILTGLTATLLTLAGLAFAPGHAAAQTGGMPSGAAAPVPAPAAGQETLTRLRNGLTVYIIQDKRFPLVCTRLYVGTGSANETARQAGISHVLEHMVFKGTEKRPKGRIAQDVEELGGYLNAATSFDMTYYLTDMPSRHWRTGMDVVKDMAFHATLDPEELESEKDVIVSELQGNEDTPSSRLFQSLQVSGLHNTVYGRPIIGFEETIRALTVQDLRDYIATWYQPQNMLLLVAGDIDPAQVLAHAQELFGDLKNTAELSMPPDVNITQAAGGPQVEVLRGPWNKVYMGLSLPVPGLRDVRSVDLDVLSFLLGGDGTSTLYRRYQYDNRLVDSIRMGNMSLQRAGLLMLTATLDVKHLETFWDSLTRDLAGLKAEDFSEEAIARARFNLTDSMDRAGETLNGLASWRGTVQFELGGRDAERNLRQAQNTVDKARLAEAIAQWLRPERVRVRVLAPQDAQLPDLQAILQRNWPAAGEAASTPASTTGSALPTETVTLGPGRLLKLQRDSTVPYVAMTFQQGGGNALLTPGQQGLAELTARTLTDGYGNMDAQQVEQWFAERAASLSASAGLQTFAVSITGPARFTQEYFQQLDSMLRTPHFSQKDMERQAQNMLAALVHRQDNPQALLFSRVRQFLFPEHCYGFDSLGTPARLQGFARKDLEAFWQRQSALPWVLTITGDIDPQAVRRWAESLPVPGGSAPQVQAPQWSEERQLAMQMPGRNQAYLLEVFPAVPQDHPDAPALMLLESVLSGQSGLLFNRLRDEQGLGYTVTAFYQSFPKTGLMAFYIGTTPDKVQQARDGFATVIESVKTDLLPASLLEKGLNRMEGSYYRQRQSLGARAAECGTEAILGLPENFRKTLLEKAATLTPEDIRAVARTYLDADKRRDLLLTPAMPAGEAAAN